MEIGYRVFAGKDAGTVAGVRAAYPCVEPYVTLEAGVAWSVLRSVAVAAGILNDEVAMQCRDVELCTGRVVERVLAVCD